jgi:hypothetical protein
VLAGDSPGVLEQILDILEEIDEDRRRAFELALHELESLVGFPWTPEVSLPIK